MIFFLIIIMSNTYIYLIIVTIVIVCIYFKNKLSEGFSRIHDSVYFDIPFLFSLPTRNFPIYHDIRGEPNIVYRPGFLGSMIPCGYKYKPYMYDVQGNHFQYMDDNEYIV